MWCLKGNRNTRLKKEKDKGKGAKRKAQSAKQKDKSLKAMRHVSGFRSEKLQNTKYIKRMQMLAF